MNPLQKDLFLDQLRQGARRRRLLAAGRKAVPLLVLLLALGFLIRPGEEGSEPGALEKPLAVTPAITPPESGEPPAPEERGGPVYHKLTDAELLDLLANQGPVLVLQPDGHQKLILTNPKVRDQES